MATITVVSPKTVYPGADSYFMQLTEANSTTLAALRWVLINATPRWAACATDPDHVFGTNMVAGVNATSGLVATDLHAYVPSTIVEANSNSVGTDPLIGVPRDMVVSTNDHQVDTANAVGTAASATNRGTAVFILKALSPKDAAGDTNIRGWWRIMPNRLQFHSSLP